MSVRSEIFNGVSNFLDTVIGHVGKGTQVVLLTTAVFRLKNVLFVLAVNYAVHTSLLPGRKFRQVG
jgi:hypothetical protein